MPFGKEPKRRILEGMLTSCPGLQPLKFSVYFIIYISEASVIRQNINPQ